jgi:hypothetical protein
MSIRCRPRHTSTSSQYIPKDCHRLKITQCSLILFNPDDVRIKYPLGSSSYIQVPAVIPSISGSGLFVLDSTYTTTSSDDVPLDDLISITVRLFEGEIIGGYYQGQKVLLKAFPNKIIPYADLLAANELNTHASLAPPTVAQASDHLARLLGGFSPDNNNNNNSEASQGEQWLVFVDDSVGTAYAWMQRAAAAGPNRLVTEDANIPIPGLSAGRGGGEWLGAFTFADPIRQRKAIIKIIINHTAQALSFMHYYGRLHQSLSPASVYLSAFDERSPANLNVRVGGLAWAVDVSDEALWGGATLAEIWEKNTIESEEEAVNPYKQLSQGLFTRARNAGAWSEADRRNFGIADDMALLGWMVLELVFGALTTNNDNSNSNRGGLVDGERLKRLLRDTFMFDLKAFRDYCEAEEGWEVAVGWLDEEGGWELVEALLCPDWKSRPTADSCLNHRFVKE